jgi:hypothetical protein
MLHHLPSHSSETPKRSQSSRLENSHLTNVDDYELHPLGITNAQELCDAPPSSLMDSTASPKVKKMEGEGVGVRSLAHSTMGVEGHVRTLKWD